MDERARQIDDWLQSEIRVTEDSIADLLKTKEILERRLIAHRLGHVGGQGSKRKNSGPRIIVEGRIMATLQRMKQARASLLQKEAKEAYPALKPATFRNYLHRLKKRGLIERAYRNGWWRLKPENPAEQFQKDIAEQLDRLTGKANVPENVKL